MNKSKAFWAILSGLCLPDVVYCGLGLWLGQLDNGTESFALSDLTVSSILKEQGNE